MSDLSAYVEQFMGDDDFHTPYIPEWTGDMAKLLYEENNDYGLTVLHLRQAIEAFLSKTVVHSEFGTHCLYCTASSDNFVNIMIHDSDCVITKAVLLLMQSKDH